MPALHFDYDIFADKLNEGFEKAADEFTRDLLVPKMKSLLDSWESRRGFESRNKWGRNFADRIMILENNDDYGKIDRKVGLAYDLMSESDLTKARIVTFGSGYNSLIPGYDDPLTTKPEKMVWDDELVEKHLSRAKKEWKLPDQWNELGTDFVREAVSQLEYEFRAFVNSRKQEIVNKALRASIVNR